MRSYAFLTRPLVELLRTMHVIFIISGQSAVQAPGDEGARCTSLYARSEKRSEGILVVIQWFPQVMQAAENLNLNLTVLLRFLMFMIVFLLPVARRYLGISCHLRFR